MSKQNKTPDKQQIGKRFSSEDEILHIADVAKFDWQHFLDYVNSYDPKKLADDKVDTILKDLLYGIGISLDDSFRYVDGYKRFMDDLKANF